MPRLARAADRFVAHMDMLGMSELTLKDPERAFDAVSNLSDAKDDILRLTIEIVSNGQLIRDQIEHVVFSDTVVLVTRGDTRADIYAIVLCMEFFFRALTYGVPVRVGVAHGRFLDDPARNLFAGPPLVNAYRLGEGAQWLGIVLDPVTAEHARAIPLQSDRGRPIITDYDVPVKSGGRETRAVADWVEPHRNHFKVPLPIAGSELYRAFEGLMGPFADLPAEAKLKYEHTSEFINLPQSV